MKKIYSLTCILLLFLAATTLAQTQEEYDVSGKVTDAQTGDPMAGISVIVKGTTRGVVTDMNGDFILKVPTTPATLQFSFIGFRTKEVEVSSSNSKIDVQLEQDVMNLEEVVISGLASSVKRSNLANSVASVSAADLAQISNQQTIDAALYGKFKGANITSNSGSPGGGMSMRLRGLTSISGSNQPLVIIDGVYLDNSSISPGLNTVSQAAGGGSQSNQDNPSNRLADINPEDIENVEILKGASAAAIYGSRASGGVIIITTKKGKEGKPEITLSQSIGVATMLKKKGTRTYDNQKIHDLYFNPTEPTSIDKVNQETALFNAAKNAGLLHDYEDELYGNNALLVNTSVSVAGGSDKTKYFVAGTRKDDEGIVKHTGYKKNSFRLNLDQELTSWLDASLNTNYIYSSADRGFFNNDNTGTSMGVSFVSTPSWAQLFPDGLGNYPDNPYAGSNFLQTRDLITNNETINRFIGGGTVTAQLLTRDAHGLKLILSGGLDRYTLFTKAIFPNTLQFQKDGNGLNGVSIQGTTENQNTNISAFLVHDFFPTGSSLNFRTQLGVTQQNFDQNNILSTASNLIGTQPNLDQSGAVAIAQNRLLQVDKGFFVQEEINYKDRIIATVGLRGDKSSNNGDVNKFFYYPKASLAVNISEFDFWDFDSFNQLKLRVAYGQAGNFAVFGSKYTSFNGVIIDGRPSSVINNVLGNAEIAPERQSELEFGFDLGLLDNRIAFDATYYIKTVTDLLLNGQVPSSSGFISKIVNAADLQNKGIEIGMDLNLVNTRNIKWESRTNFWKNTGEVTRLDLPTFTTGGFADFLGQFRLKEGHSPTEIIGVGPNPDEDGYMVFGNSEPDFQMSFINSVNYKKFELSMIWHWKKGGENVNLSALLSDLAGTSPDFDDIDLDPEKELGNGPYRLSNVGSNTAPLIEDAGYMRMREIGLYYNFTGGFVNRFARNVKVGFSGNNLINFFKYSSYDPEVSNFGGAGLSSGIEVTPFPSSKRMNFHVIVKF
jgi:TonB-linked SusC/RagA family outer membrane protein